MDDEGNPVDDPEGEIPKPAAATKAWWLSTWLPTPAMRADLPTHSLPDLAVPDSAALAAAKPARSRPPPCCKCRNWASALTLVRRRRQALFYRER